MYNNAIQLNWISHLHTAYAMQLLHYLTYIFVYPINVIYVEVSITKNVSKLQQNRSQRKHFAVPLPHWLLPMQAYAAFRVKQVFSAMLFQL